MKGTLKHVLSIYLMMFLLSIPTVSMETEFRDRKTITEIKIERTVQFIKSKWKVDPRTAEITVNLAYKHGHKDKFPTPNDILAIIAIESGFNKYAISSANAKGLMQVLYKPTSFDIAQNIRDGVWLLRDYSNRLPINGTIHAYNVGIGNYRAGVRNYNYFYKFILIKQQLESV